jgi:hypothetical protein
MSMLKVALDEIFCFREYFVDRRRAKAELIPSGFLYRSEIKTISDCGDNPRFLCGIRVGKYSLENIRQNRLQL